MSGDEIEFGLDELRESVRQVLGDDAARLSETIPGEDGRSFDRALWTRMAELGWLALTIEEQHGGLGLGFAHAAVLHEELGRVLACVPLAGTLAIADLIAAAGSHSLQARWLPMIAAGEAVAAFVAPGAAVDVPTVGAGDLIDAAFSYVPFADVADLIAFPVRIDGTVAIAVLPAASDGVTVTRQHAVDLTRTLARIDLRRVDLGVAEILRLPGETTERIVDQLAVALASDAIGGAAAILERTVEYMTIREQFGRPIGSFQALKHRAANWKVLLEAATALVHHAADALAMGQPDAPMLASAAKFYGCDTYAAIAADAIQLHGGIGFTWEQVCHLFLKRAKLSQQLLGSSSQHKDRVARFAFDMADRGADADARAVEFNLA
jgi:alkylation response protein AidB-like acyl-CoA dehydrogenase